MEEPAGAGEGVVDVDGVAIRIAQAVGEASVEVLDATQGVVVPCVPRNSKQDTAHTKTTKGGMLSLSPG